MQRKYDINDYLKSSHVDLATLQNFASQYVAQSKDAEFRFAYEIIFSAGLTAAWNNERENLKVMHAVNYLLALNKNRRETILAEVGEIRSIIQSDLYQNLLKCGLSKYYLEIANFESGSGQKYSDRIARSLRWLHQRDASEEQIKSAVGDLLIRLVRPTKNEVNEELVEIVRKYLSIHHEGKYADNIRELLHDYTEKNMTTENFLRGVLDEMVKKYQETHALDRERKLLKALLAKAPDISRVMQESSIHYPGSSRGAVIKAAFEPVSMIQKLLEGREKLIKAIDDALSPRKSMREVEGGWEQEEVSTKHSKPED